MTNDEWNEAQSRDILAAFLRCMNRLNALSHDDCDNLYYCKLRWLVKDEQ